MTIQQAIEKAIEGGYPKNKTTSWGAWYEMLLDPSFWQSLGKAMGWGEFAKCQHTYPQDPPHSGNFSHICDKCGDTFDMMQAKSWLDHWHRFIDHLAEGKSIEDFFTTLEAKK